MSCLHLPTFFCNVSNFTIQFQQFNKGEKSYDRLFFNTFKVCALAFASQKNSGSLQTHTRHIPKPDLVHAADVRTIARQLFPHVQEQPKAIAYAARGLKPI